MRYPAPEVEDESILGDLGSYIGRSHDNFLQPVTRVGRTRDPQPKRVERSLYCSRPGPSTHAGSRTTSPHRNDGGREIPYS